MTQDRRRRFETEVLAHLDAAHRFARWLTRSAADADDIVQDAILRAYRGFDGLRGSDAKAWLLTIVKNCHATALRQERRRAAVPLPEEHEEHGHAMVAPGPDPESASIRHDNDRALHRLIAMLPEEQREVLVLREIEGLGYRAIAAVAQVPIGTVMSRLARARAALRVSWVHMDPGGSHDLR
jgi:RNA polymerase sigma-70 factor (ECF subfamily)